MPTILTTQHHSPRHHSTPPTPRTAACPSLLHAAILLPPLCVGSITWTAWTACATPSTPPPPPTPIHLPTPVCPLLLSPFLLPPPPSPPPPSSPPWPSPLPLLSTSLFPPRALLSPLPPHLLLPYLRRPSPASCAVNPRPFVLIRRTKDALSRPLLPPSAAPVVRLLVRCSERLNPTSTPPPPAHRESPSAVRCSVNPDSFVFTPGSKEAQSRPLQSLLTASAFPPSPAGRPQPLPCVASPTCSDLCFAPSRWILIHPSSLFMHKTRRPRLSYLLPAAQSHLSSFVAGQASTPAPHHLPSSRANFRHLLLSGF